VLVVVEIGLERGFGSAKAGEDVSVPMIADCKVRLGRQTRLVKLEVVLLEISMT